MEELLKDYGLERIRVGDVLTGKVITITDTEIMVSIGYRSDGIVSVTELPNETTADYSEGDEVQVMVVKVDDGEGNVLLSVNRAYYAVVWEDFAEFMETGETFEIHIKESVKGGIVGRYKGARVFVPASLVSARYVEDLSAFVGEKMIVKMEDLDIEKKRAVASRKAIEMEEVKKQQAAAFETLEAGQVIEGTVRRLESFGAFIDLGGVDGLMHVSQMSWKRISHPKQLMSVGDKVDAEIISIDKEKQKISLKLANPPENPWTNIHAKYSEGAEYSGKVAKLMDFGAFITLEDGIEGLCHVSEISEERIQTPADALKEGQDVKVRILSIDTKKRRISLTMKEGSKPEVSVTEGVLEPVKPTTMADLFGDKLKALLK